MGNSSVAHHCSAELPDLLGQWSAYLGKISLWFYRYTGPHGTTGSGIYLDLYSGISILGSELYISRSEGKRSVLPVCGHRPDHSSDLFCDFSDSSDYQCETWKLQETPGQNRCCSLFMPWMEVTALRICFHLFIVMWAGWAGAVFTNLRKYRNGISIFLWSLQY